MASIVTGYTGKNHITSDDWASLNAGILSSGDIVLSLNAPEAKETTSGVVTLPKMELSIQGVHCRTDGTEKVTVATGSQGLYRNDLIIGRYRKNSSSGVESFEIDIVKGTAASQAEDPALTVNNIRTGGTLREVALFRVVLYGSNIQSITAVITNVGAMRDIQSMASGAKSTADNFNAKLNTTNANVSELQRRMNTQESKLDFSGVLRSISEYAKAAIQSWVSEYDSSTSKPDVLGARLAVQDANGTEKASLRIYSNGKIQYSFGDNDYNIPIIQRGTVSVSTSKANEAVKKDITFSKPYRTAPNVFVTVHANDPLKYGVSVSNVTTKGFTAVYNATGAASATVEWCAIGRIDQ